jgi:hypothetical protein
LYLSVSVQPCTPGSFAPIVIEQVSLVASISGVSEVVLFIQIREPSPSTVEYEHVVPLQSFGGTVFGTQLTRLYVPENWTLYIEVKLYASVSGAARIDYSGYRVIVD